MRRRYAAETTVSASRSMEEIQRTLERYGADEFVFGQRADRAAVEFVLFERRVRITFPLPSAAEASVTPSGRVRRDSKVVGEAHAKAVRQRWRAVALVVKAKLETVEAGISTLEHEFLAFIVLPTGETLGQWAIPRLAADTLTTQMLLPGGRTYDLAAEREQGR